MDDGDSAAMSLFEGMVLFDNSELLHSPLPASSSSSNKNAAAAMNSGQGNRENEEKEEREVHASPPSTPSSSVPDSAPSVSPVPSIVSATEPLDEDLFSNLTLLTPTPGSSSIASSPREPSPVLEKMALGSGGIKATGHAPLASELPGTIDQSGPPSRQMSRKKKRAVRVGYARETTPSATTPSASFALPARLEVSQSDGYTEPAVENYQTIMQPFDGELTLTSHCSDILESQQKGLQAPKDPRVTSIECAEEEIQSLSSEKEISAAYESEIFQDCQVNGGSAEPSIGISANEPDLPEEITPTSESLQKGDAFLLTDGKLELIRAEVTEKLDRIRSLALSVWAEKKNLAKLLRNAGEDVNTVSLRLKNLERELEEACEAEDFERAERVSQDLAAAEEEKNTLQGKLRQIEYDCESVDSKMEDIFKMQIATEEEGMLLFRQFAEDSSADADSILNTADGTASEEIQEWQFLSEALEMKRLQTDIELQLVNGANDGLQTFVQQVTQKEREEKKQLCNKQAILSKELEDLLELVRLKETQIAENQMLIDAVEKKISHTALQFKDSQKFLDSNFNRLQSTLSSMKLEAEAFSLKKQNIDKNHNAAKCKGLKLKEISIASADEARKVSDLVKLRKLLAMPTLKSREEKLKLTKTEEEILKDLELLKQHISTARSAIQELSLSRSRIQEEMASSKQRISFIDIRCPELENEKKGAAAARNFKEAGRIAAEAKTLSLEKQFIQDKIAKSALDLEKIEGELNDTYRKIQENEELVLLKEKEAARAAFQKLHVTVATAKAERFAALTLGDSEEDGVALKEVESAENRAKDLQEAYNFDEMDLEHISEQLFSLSLITCLSGKKLAFLASSLDLTVSDDT